MSSEMTFKVILVVGKKIIVVAGGILVFDFELFIGGLVALEEHFERIEEQLESR